MDEGENIIFGSDVPLFEGEVKREEEYIFGEDTEIHPEHGSVGRLANAIRAIKLTHRDGSSTIIHRRRGWLALTDGTLTKDNFEWDLPKGARFGAHEDNARKAK